MPETTVDRRAFARWLTAGAIGSLPLAAAAAEPEKKEKEEPKPPNPVDLVLELVKRQYPEGLEEEHLRLIRRDIESSLNRSRVLSSFPLVNADEPAFVFSAYRKQGS